MLSKIKYGVVITVAFQALRLFVDVPVSIEEAIRALVENSLILFPWFMAWFVKESKANLKGLKLKK